MNTDEHGAFLIEALSVLIRGYPWLDLSSFGMARSHASQSRSFRYAISQFHESRSARSS